jgi:integrase
MIALKKKTVHKSRSINLTSSGVVAVDHLFKMLDDNLQIPSRQAMTGVLQRAAVEAKLPDGDKGICPKMFRKTWVSWLMNTFPALMFKIASNMGHTLAVMENNYSNLTFADDDAEDIAKFVKGWGGTK